MTPAIIGRCSFIYIIRSTIANRQTLDHSPITISFLLRLIHLLHFMPEIRNKPFHCFQNKTKNKYFYVRHFLCHSQWTRNREWAYVPTFSLSLAVDNVLNSEYIYGNWKHTVRQIRLWSRPKRSVATVRCDNEVPSHRPRPCIYLVHGENHCLPLYLIGF